MTDTPYAGSERRRAVRTRQAGEREPYAGPERRFHTQTLPRPPRVIGRARLRPQWAQGRPGFQAGRWYPVLEHAPGPGLLPPPPGSFWLEVDGRPRLAQAERFEVESVGQGAE